MNPYVAAAITDWQKQHSLRVDLPRQTAPAAAREATGLHGTSSFGMSGVNAHLLLSPPPYPHTASTSDVTAPAFHPPVFSRSRVWPAPSSFHSVQMVRVVGAKAEIAADLTHPAMASLWTTKVHGSRILPTSLQLEAAAAAALLAAAAGSSSGLSLQAVAVQRSMVLGMRDATTAGTKAATLLHVQLDTLSGVIGTSSTGTLHLSASAAPMRSHLSKPSPSPKAPSAAIAVSKAAQKALPTLASHAYLPESPVGGADNSGSFQDGFYTHCGQAEAALTLASLNMTPTAQPAQTPTACSSVVFVTPRIHAGRPAGDAWTSASTAGRQNGLLSSSCSLRSAAGTSMSFASAVFASHPMALQPSGLGLQLLWKPTPLAAVSPQACHRKWLLISLAQSHDARIFADGWNTSWGQQPQVVHVILRAGTDSGERSAASSPSEGSPHFVESEEELQRVVKQQEADHCFIIQPHDPSMSGTRCTLVEIVNCMTLR